MKKSMIVSVVFFMAVGFILAGSGVLFAEGEVPASSVGEQVTVKGQYVRLAANAEGWVTMGYGIANLSVGEEWMLIDVGLTVQHGVQPQKISRNDITIVTPDKKVIPLPTAEEFGKVRGSLRALDQRANMTVESINYFPPGVNEPCRLGFFSHPDQGPGLAHDTTELDPQRACMGRLYFQIPGGIQYGLHNLDVKFAGSTVRVPFKIMTKEEAKAFEKEWKAAEKKEKAEKKAEHKGHKHE